MVHSQPGNLDNQQANASEDYLLKRMQGQDTGTSGGKKTRDTDAEMLTVIISQETGLRVMFMSFFGFLLFNHVYIEGYKREK